MKTAGPTMIDGTKWVPDDPTISRAIQIFTDMVGPVVLQHRTVQGGTYYLLVAGVKVRVSDHNQTRYLYKYDIRYRASMPWHSVRAQVRRVARQITEITGQGRKSEKT